MLCALRVVKMPHVVYRSSFQAFIREKVALSYKLTATVGEFWKWNRNLVDVGKQEMFACVFAGYGLGSLGEQRSPN